MSQPFNIEPGSVGDAGAGWDADILDFGAPPPQVSGGPNDPTVGAAQRAIADAQRRTHSFQNAVGQTADQTKRAAGTYEGQEKDSAKGLGDSTGIANNLIGSATSLIGELPQAFGVFTQGIGALTGLVGAGAGTIGSLTGAAVSGQHLANPDQSDQPEHGNGHNPGGWNPNNNNPEDSHDFVHPDHFDGGHL